MKNEFTNQEYWEKYYKNSSVDRDEIIRICGHFDPFYKLLVDSCSKIPETIIEIGAYPGRYLAYLSARNDLKATALDFNSDEKKIKDAFGVMEGHLTEVIQADFLKYSTKKNYDLVFSNGFIEHFENFEEILDRHNDYLKPGGAMMIMIPNKRYLRKYYGLLLDRENLKAHNLKSMKLSVFKKFAIRNKLNIKYLSYYGGFAYRVHQPLNFAQKVIYKITRSVFKQINPFLTKHPHPLYSGTIIAIFQKPDE